MSTVTEPFVHPALFYANTDEYLAGCVPFVREGLERGEPVAVAVPSYNLELIEAGLGEDAARVRFLDMQQAGRNPGRIIPGVLRAFADSHPDAGRVRLIGEPIWSGRSETEYPACAQHEALINHAFTGRAVSILCPYDTGRLDERSLADAYVTHPVVIDGAGRHSDSPAYDPDGLVARYNQPLPAAPGGIRLAYDYDAGTLPTARHRSVAEAAQLGLAGERLDDFALIVAELTTNSVVHGGGRGTVRLWSEEGRLVCEVRDAGHLTDPLAGRRPAGRDQIGGRGLLTVNLLADLVRTHTGGYGTTIRVYLAL
ncbi:anti-sigma factor RsbA family regulatory protein [Streptomyces abyssomicinicus]|uniref:anti-sigma factor RsbA family regulatory protein n=1 Tax=Streptomyces abyssomicinicus TaxID=574929 RepID=UPI0012500697|nr:anti-sigma factor RsbA family regulatory protein [Streptomyces abyssomicinicus]